MSTSAIVRVCGLALSVVGTSAQAEWRCDCTTILDTCSATVTVQNDSVSIDSDHAQCARVDYLIDGLPFVALVVDGHEQLSWLNRSDNPRVLMQSCQVCLDHAGGSAPVLTARGPAVAQGDERSREPELSRLLAVDPQYPSSAAETGVEGFVEVSFTVTALGLVENAIV